MHGNRTMTATPLAFADPPPRAANLPALDVLSDVLRAVRLTGAVFMTSRLTAPFGITSPKRYDPGMPMAKFRHVSIFHLVVTGECTFESAGGHRELLRAGDLVLLPFSNAHKLCSGEPSGLTSA